MSEHAYKSHNKRLLLYHLVFPAKYRREAFAEIVEESLRDVCLGIGERYEIVFVEIGMEENHVHFLVQGVPTMSVTRLVTIIKSVTAKEIFRRHPEVKKILWGGSLWTYRILCEHRRSLYLRGCNCEIRKEPREDL